MQPYRLRQNSTRKHGSTTAQANVWARRWKSSQTNELRRRRDGERTRRLLAMLDAVRDLPTREQLLGGRSLRWVAGQAGVSHTQLSKWFAGQRKDGPRLLDGCAIATALGVDPHVLAAWIAVARAKRLKHIASVRARREGEG